MGNPPLNKDLITLLQVENNKDLLEYACPKTGVSVWPLIRISVLRTIMSDWLYKSIPLSSVKRKTKYSELAKNAALSTAHNISYNATGRRDILVQSTGLGNFVHEGVTHDRLAGYFSEAIPERTLVFQDKPKQHHGQIYSFEPILFRTPYNIIHSTYSRLAVKANHKEIARDLVECVSRNAVECFGYTFNAQQVQAFSNSLAQKIAAFPFATDAYANFFAKRKIRLLLKEDACYGGNSIPIIHAAKLSNVVVAEYQHGAISKGHDAYNVADVLVSSSAFQKVLPDYLLTYGNWWSSQTNLPIKKVPIGNPHLTESIGKMGQLEKSRTKVLILGDGVETGMYLELASHISGFTRNQELTVAFRPHPFERNRVRSSQLPSGVVLDTHSNIFSSLVESRVVIGELSTGLFEAVGLCDMVLLWETEKSRFAFPELPFRSFSDVDEIEVILRNGSIYSCESKLSHQSELWEPNWKKNYLNFVDGVIGH